MPSKPLHLGSWAGARSQLALKARSIKHALPMICERWSVGGRVEVRASAFGMAVGPDGHISARSMGPGPNVRRFLPFSADEDQVEKC